jgi:mono/diheme cytochrome c family protein
MIRQSRTLNYSIFLTCLAALAGCQAQSNKPAAAATTAAAVAGNSADLLARGENLIRTTGCNDCHTVGYAESQGTLPKSEWLKGSPLGYNGPWGTTYAPNLRLRLQEMNEVQWLEFSANLRTRPIMPDFAVRAMTEDDRRAIFRFVQSLGPAGQPAPAFLPPGKTPPAPYFGLVLPPPPASAETPEKTVASATTP